MSDSLDKMRRGLKAAEDIELPMDPKFFDKLHDKIMAKVDETSIEPRSSFRSTKRLLRAHWRGWLYPTGGRLSLAIAVSLLLALQVSKQYHSHGVQAEVAPLNESGERVVAAALDFPDLITQTVLTSQAESDFFVDVANDSIENLSISQVNRIMGESRR